MKSTNRITQTYEIFHELMPAINQQDHEKLASITSQYKLSHLPSLPFLTDDKGDTIAHALCRCSNKNFMKLILQGAEVQFRPSFYIANLENKKSLDCMQDNEINTPLKNMLKRNLLSIQPSYSQAWILDQFKLYLYHQATRNQAAYSIESIDNICQQIEEGQCFGFCSLWAKGCLNKNYHSYSDLLRDIILWDRDYKNINTNLSIKFETAISLIRSHHDLPFEMTDQLVQRDRLIKNGLFNNILENAKDFQYRQRDYSSSSYNSSNHQYEIIKNWGVDHYQCENNLMLYPTNQFDIGDYFTEFLKPENNGKVLVIWAAEHYISCYFLDNNLYLINPSDEIICSANDNNFNEPLGTKIDITKEQSMNDILDFISNSFFKENKREIKNENNFDWGPTVYSINFRALDLRGKQVGHYPTQESLESKWEAKNNISLSHKQI